MFGSIKDLVEILKSATDSIVSIRQKKARKKAIIELLAIYFVLAEVEREGRELLKSIGREPLRKISRLRGRKREATLVNWSQVARRQASRLYWVAGLLSNQHALSFLSPRTKRQLEQVVGSKFERTDSLHGIGAGLVIYAEFGDKDDHDWLLGVVSSMYPKASDKLLNVKQAKTELKNLGQILESYRAVCEKLVTPDEVVLLAAEAKRKAGLGSGVT